MTAKVNHLVPLTDQGNIGGGNWPDELKGIICTLIDLFAAVLQSDGTKLALNGVLTPEELSARFKIPVSTIGPEGLRRDTHKGRPGPAELTLPPSHVRFAPTSAGRVACLRQRAARPQQYPNHGGHLRSLNSWGKPLGGGPT